MAIRYFALIGDLTRSRRKAERALLAEHIEAMKRQVNDRFAHAFVAPLETTRGLDEVSSLLQRPAHAFDIVSSVNLLLWPATFRFALGEGTVDVWGHSGRASDMDGPAFHHAADALTRGRNKNLLFSVKVQDLSPGLGDLLEAAASLHHAVTHDWTANIARTIQLYRPGTGETPTQEQVATQLGQTQQAVSDAVRRGHLTELTSIEYAVRQVLSSYASSPDS